MRGKVRESWRAREHSAEESEPEPGDMLANRSGMSHHCGAAPRVPGGGETDLVELDCVPAAGFCPWARFPGVDGCLAEPYCLWLKLLARANWGDLELGLRCQDALCWRRLAEETRRNCLRLRVRRGPGSRGHVVGRACFTIARACCREHLEGVFGTNALAFLRGCGGVCVAGRAACIGLHGRTVSGQFSFPLEFFFFFFSL